MFGLASVFGEHSLPVTLTPPCTTGPPNPPVGSTASSDWPCGSTFGAGTRILKEPPSVAGWLASGTFRA